MITCCVKDVCVCVCVDRARFSFRRFCGWVVWGDPCDPQICISVCNGAKTPIKRDFTCHDRCDKLEALSTLESERESGEQRRCTVESNPWKHCGTGSAQYDRSIELSDLSLWKCVHRGEQGRASVVGLGPEVRRCVRTYRPGNRGVTVWLMWGEVTPAAQVCDLERCDYARCVLH